MIKAEVVFDGDSITVNGKKFTVAAELILGLEGLSEYSTIEEAIKYCLEN